jgi:disulfide oxidoreductase YuzD
MKFEIIFPNGEKEITTIDMVDAPSLKEPMEWLLNAQLGKLPPIGLTLDNGVYIGFYNDPVADKNE